MALQEVSIGFAAGQVLAAKIEEGELEGLRTALRSGSGWHRIKAEGATIDIDLGSVVYLRSERDEPRVGFGA
jgi:hypothetical protein